MAWIGGWTSAVAYKVYEARFLGMGDVLRCRFNLLFAGSESSGYSTAQCWSRRRYVHRRVQDWGHGLSESASRSHCRALQRVFTLDDSVVITGLEGCSDSNVPASLHSLHFETPRETQREESPAIGRFSLFLVLAPALRILYRLCLDCRHTSNGAKEVHSSSSVSGRPSRCRYRHSLRLSWGRGHRS